MFVRRIDHYEFCCNENDIQRPLRGEIKSIAPFRNDPHFTKRETRRSTGLLPLGLAGMEKTPVAEIEKQLHSILATLETCQAALVASDSRETAQLVSVAILDLRMRLN